MLYQEALQVFADTFREAQEQEAVEPTAFTLATCGSDGQPSARTLLLKGVDERGFVFYTNKHSRKAEQIQANSKVAMCFFWRALMKQVHIEGQVTHVADAESDAYWASRPRLSQLGGWASLQSQVMGEESSLEQRLQTYEKQFADQAVPRPPHWGGYVLMPKRIEFWYSKPGRMHERVCYEHDGDVWIKHALYP